MQAEGWQGESPERAPVQGRYCHLGQLHLGLWQEWVSTEGPQRQSGNQIPECLALTDVGSRVNLKEDTDVKRKSWFGRF